jgi:hypothetical protein
MAVPVGCVSVDISLVLKLSQHMSGYDGEHGATYLLLEALQPEVGEDVPSHSRTLPIGPGQSSHAGGRIVHWCVELVLFRVVPTPTGATSLVLSVALSRGAFILA